LKCSERMTNAHSELSNRAPFVMLVDYNQQLMIRFASCPR
jgi:hypothetical protein